MATQADVRRIAMALPEVQEGQESFGFSVENKGKQRGFCWLWKERIEPKKARVPNPGVLAIRVDGDDAKQMLLSADGAGDKFFTEPHYNGFPAILVRLRAVKVAELRVLLTTAWRCLAPNALVADFDARLRKR